MDSLELRGSPTAILAALGPHPRLPNVKRQLLDYQMAALYHLARDYDKPEAVMLEIGSGAGGSGYMLALGAPRSRIISLTTSPGDAAAATGLWRRAGLRNIKVVEQPSWEFLENTGAGGWSLIFVDGDHNRIAKDLPWYNWLAVGGLMLFHDYSPETSPRPSGIVYSELNTMAERLGRSFDVSIIDDTGTGMVGFYKREGERWE